MGFVRLKIELETNVSVDDIIWVLYSKERLKWDKSILEYESK